MIPTGVVDAVRKYLTKTIDRLAPPAAYLVRMHLMLGRDLPDRLVAPQRFQRPPRLEFRREPAPFRRRVFLRYPVEYTLTRIAQMAPPCQWRSKKGPPWRCNKGPLYPKTPNSRIRYVLSAVFETAFCPRLSGNKIESVRFFHILCLR